MMYRNVVDRTKMSIQNIDKLDAIIEPALRAAEVPGAAIAIVADDRVILARGYGYRDLDAKLAMTADTVYPIASTTKSISATLLGILVDRGELAWDVPVQKYLPQFRLQDRLAAAAVTMRDMVAMRTGLPRHDLVWIENSSTRSELVKAFEHLPLSAGFRERFQYNNLTVTLAAHIAEIVTGESWEELVLKNILEPLQMSDTTFALPETGNATVSYHENCERKLVRHRRLCTQLAAPAGGTIHSTIRDMSRWVAFNLRGGKAAGRQLISPNSLAELHSPCVLMGDEPMAPSATAAYGLGWAVDTCNGRTRLSHGGDLHDVSSCLTLFPEDHLGIVSFVNLAAPRLASAVNQCAFDVIMGFESARAITNALIDYERKIESTRLRNSRPRRVTNTSPSHDLDDYCGTYQHAAYGRVEILHREEALVLRRNSLILPLEHWHYDIWAVAENDRFPIYRPNAFERANSLVFETSADGEIAGLSMQPEPATAPIRFEKQGFIVR